MLTARDAKAKIRSVRKIDQICRAMKTVASIRLRRAESRLASARAYQRALAGLVGRLPGAAEGHPFLARREGGPIGLVLVTSDRGLCGGYNAGSIRLALQVGGPDRVRVVALGRRGQVQMARRGYPIMDRLVPLGSEPDVYAVRRLADRIGELYLEERFDQVTVVFSRFLGGTRSQVTAEALLPLAPARAAEPGAIAAAGGGGLPGRSPEDPGLQLLEPPLPHLLPGLVRRYLRGQLVGMVLEASASEHAARVAAMTAATDNAEEMTRDLTLAYNKARQAGITKELTEIVGASEATV